MRELALIIVVLLGARPPKHPKAPKAEKVDAQPAKTRVEHCHLKDAAGNLVDANELKSEKVCEAKDGVWLEHHAHCHQLDAGGKQADLPDARTEAECSSRNGTWLDHGHEGTAGKK